MPLKHLAALSVERTRNEPAPLLTLDAVEGGTGGVIGDPWSESFEPPSTGVADVEPGDVLFGKLRPYLAKVTLAPQSAYASTELLCLRPKVGVDPRWLAYRMLSRPVVDWAVATSEGTKMPRTSWDRLSCVSLPVPTKAEQRAIADFLDAETARIDALMTRKRQLRILLQQRRWASFDTLVGAIDAEVLPLRRALISVTDGPFGSAFSSSEYSEDGVVVVRLGNIGFAQWLGDGLAFLPARRAKEFEQFRVQHGDLLVAGLGDLTNHAGRACVAPDLGPAIVKGKCFCARIDQAVAVPMYLALCCSSPSGAKAMAVEARGSTRSMINLDIFKSVPVPLPGLSIQRKIVEAVQVEWDKTAAISDRLNRQIALLQERRQALITAAVTGELGFAEAG